MFNRSKTVTVGRLLLTHKEAIFCTPQWYNQHLAVVMITGQFQKMFTLCYMCSKIGWYDVTIIKHFSRHVIGNIFQIEC